MTKSQRTWAAMAMGLTAVCATSPELSYGEDPDVAPPSSQVREMAEFLGFGPLDSVPVPGPTNLGAFVKNKAAAIRLGKALFWDHQMGSDGQACASCHFHAGADNRRRNQRNPGNRSVPADSIFGPVGSDPGGGPKGPNYKATDADFPFHRLADVTDTDSTVLFDTNDVFSSQGTFGGTFLSLKLPGEVVLGPNENVDHDIPDPHGFQVGDIRVRRVEPRNTPTVINAVFNHRNFWDARANNVFNGVDPFGERSPARVWVYRRGTLKRRRIALANSSLGSQAVGPPGSDFEMGAAGRPFAMMGRKMLFLRPLNLQKVRHDDSVLGPIARSSPSTLRRGLKQSYATMIRRAFRSRYWRAPGTVDGTFTQMEANFSLFWGLAIQCYEATLVSGEAPFDEFMRGAETLTDEQKIGMQLFMGEAKCATCHQGPEFTQASVNQLLNERGGELDHIPAKVPDVLERMVMGSIKPLLGPGEPAIYDNGFYNIGCRPTSDDIGIGGTDPFGNPLSFSRQATGGNFVDFAPIDATRFEVLPGIFPMPGERVAVDGAFKVPTLRNVELTGPFFHHGGMATLVQVVEFYARRGNFAAPNIDNLDPDIERLSAIRGLPSRVAAVAAFLRSLTDPRVTYRKAPFDHPQYFIFDGGKGDHLAVPDSDGDGLADDRIKVLGAVGAAGAAEPLLPFLED